MTRPDNPFPVEAPDLIGIGAQSIVDRAKPLGLTWTRRMATVVDAITDPANTIILFDGDSINTTAVSMVGALPPDTRVYVDMVPPAANFITGLVADNLNPIFFGAISYNAALAAGTTTSATYVNLPGNPSMTLTKTYLQTRIRLDLHVTSFSTLTNTSVRYAININGSTDGDMCQIVINPANTHTQVSGTVIFPFTASGSVPLVARWRRPAGGGTLTTDTNDWLSMTAQEVE